MNYDDYKVTLEYPNKKDFMTTYYYKGGECIETVQGYGPDKNGFVIERSVNELDYKNARTIYKNAEYSAYTKFKNDLFNELGIENNPKRELLFSKAWEMGHSSGYYSVFEHAEDLVDLIL